VGLGLGLGLGLGMGGMGLPPPPNSLRASSLSSSGSILGITNNTNTGTGNTGNTNTGNTNTGNTGNTNIDPGLQPESLVASADELTPGMRFCHVGVVYENAFYIFGGYDGLQR
jgi:hypothetical protein